MMDRSQIYTRPGEDSKLIYILMICLCKFCIKPDEVIKSLLSCYVAIFTAHDTSINKSDYFLSEHYEETG